MSKFILWDHDGVLVDTEYWYFKSTQRALSELGITLDQPSYREFMIKGQSSWSLAHNANVDFREINKKRVLRDKYYHEFILNEDIEIPGVLSVLEALSKTHKMAIVTTSKRADFELIHKHRLIVPYMDFVLAREDYDNSKPHPEPYLLALDKFGAQAADALVVEDSQRGLQSAIAAKIDCAVVHNDFTANHDFSGARYRVKSLDELIAIAYS